MLALDMMERLKLNQWRVCDMCLGPGPVLRVSAVFIGVLFACSAVEFLADDEYVMAAMYVGVIGMQGTVYGLAMANDELKAEIRRLKGEAE